MKEIWFRIAVIRITCPFPDREKIEASKGGVCVAVGVWEERMGAEHGARMCTQFQAPGSASHPSGRPGRNDV